jgi:prevent-host-death family protein
MKVINYTELRSELKKHLDYIEESNDIVIVKRSKGKASVLLSLHMYEQIKNKNSDGIKH